MPKKKPLDRLAALRAFIATQEDRLANLKAAQKIKAKIEAASKEAEILEIDEANRRKNEELEAAKAAANQKRKDDQRAKLLWGGCLQRLDSPEAAHIRAKILEVLNENDRNWMVKYADRHKIVLSASKELKPQPQTDDAPPIVSAQVDPTATAVMCALKKFDSMTLSHIEGEFLSCSDGKDRHLIEVLFANLGKRGQANDRIEQEPPKEP